MQSLLTMALYYGKPSTIARVDGVVAEGAAAAAGFKIGDVVVQIDGKPIESFADMIVGGEPCAAKCSWVTQEQFSSFSRAHRVTKLPRVRNCECAALFSPHKFSC